MWSSYDRTWFPGPYKQEILILILIDPHVILQVEPNLPAASQDLKHLWYVYSIQSKDRASKHGIQKQTYMYKVLKTNIHTCTNY
jgi:hypothetical protein